MKDDIPCIYEINGSAVYVNRMERGDLRVDFGHELNATVNPIMSGRGEIYGRGWILFKQEREAFFADLDRIGKRTWPVNTP